MWKGGIDFSSRNGKSYIKVLGTSKGTHEERGKRKKSVYKKSPGLLLDEVRDG